MLVKYIDDHYELLCQSFFYFAIVKVWPSSSLVDYSNSGFVNLENWAMIDRELLRGFAEIAGAVSATKRNVAK